MEKVEKSGKSGNKSGKSGKKVEKVEKSGKKWKKWKKVEKVEESVVFSNEFPDSTRMSEDRWTVYSTDGEYLFKDNGNNVF